MEELLFDDHQLYGKNLARKKGEKSGSTYLHTIAGGDCPKFETFFSVQNLALISIFAILLQRFKVFSILGLLLKVLEIFGMKISLKSDIGVASNLRECEGSAEILKKSF